MPIRPKSEFLVFGQPEIQEDEIDDVIDSMRKGWLGTGPKVAKFEQDFSVYKNTPNVAALNSCTAALHLSLLAAGIGPGDEVITSPMTFCATANAIIHAGATPVLADIDLHSLNISPDRIREKITSKTRAILPVHFAGRACEMDAIVSIVIQTDRLYRPPQPTPVKIQMQLLQHMLYLSPLIQMKLSHHLNIQLVKQKIARRIPIRSLLRRLIYQ